MRNLGPDVLNDVESRAAALLCQSFLAALLEVGFIYALLLECFVCNLIDLIQVFLEDFRRHCSERYRHERVFVQDIVANVTKVESRMLNSVVVEVIDKFHALTVVEIVASLLIEKHNGALAVDRVQLHE